MRPARARQRLVATFVALIVCGGVACGESRASAGPASDAAAARTLRVLISGEGSVTSADRRIDCGTDCSARYHDDLASTLRAEPAPDFVFAHWSGACVGTRRRCAVALDRTTTARATFERRLRLVRLTVGGPGTVISQPQGLVCGSSATTCSATFGQGSTVRLVAVPDVDGRFVSWVGAACAPQSVPICDVAIRDGDAAVPAVFGRAVPDQGDVPLTVTPILGRVLSTPPGIDCPPACGGSFPTGTLVSLMARAEDATWRGACIGIGAACALVLDRPSDVGALVPPVPSPARKFGLSVTVTGPGVVTGGHSYASDEIRCGGASGTLLDCQHVFDAEAVVRLRAVRLEGASFKRWRYFCSGKRRRCQLRLTAPKTVGAVFRR